MRIAFDGTTLRPERTGVGYYTEHLLQHLVREASADRFIVLSNKRPETTALPSNVRVAYDRRALFQLAWMQLLAPRMLESIHADLAHFTNGIIPLATGVPTVVTIHDMSLTLYPQYHPLRRVVLNRPLVRLAARRASAIITVSHSAKRDIVGLYGLDPERVHVIHEAAAPSFRPVSDRETLEAVRRKYGLPDRFILYVGTIEPRKNLKRLLDAFASRRDTGDLRPALVCVGPYGWLSRGLKRRLAALGADRAVRFTGYVPFADLPAIYSLCEMFVFPSLYEGFGLPVMEAMACGAPAIVGRNAALVEIAGGAAEVIDPLDTEMLGDAMVSLATDPERRRHIGQMGLERSRRFSWERAARQTLAVYRAAAGSARPASIEPAVAFQEVGIASPTPRAAAGEQRPWKMY
jgi:glycosyltransferase involved in cell wall biosynthesis